MKFVLKSGIQPKYKNKKEFLNYKNGFICPNFQVQSLGDFACTDLVTGSFAFCQCSSLEKNFTFGYTRFPMSQDILMFFTAVSKWVNSTEKGSHV